MGMVFQKIAILSSMEIIMKIAFMDGPSLIVQIYLTRAISGFLKIALDHSIYGNVLMFTPLGMYLSLEIQNIFFLVTDAAIYSDVSDSRTKSIKSSIHLVQKLNIKRLSEKYEVTLFFEKVSNYKYVNS